MAETHRDDSLDTLLDLDGEVLFIDEKHWVKFTVKRVEPTPERPHGLSYSLTLHGEDGSVWSASIMRIPFDIRAVRQGGRDALTTIGIGIARSVPMIMRTEACCWLIFGPKSMRC
jgi:hypothetical protein